jgi:putative endonuclease
VQALLNINNMVFYVYIVECSDGTFYTGFTSNVKRRIFQHNNNRYGAKSLRGKRPVKIIYSEKLNSKSIAMRREREIKGWNRKKKLNLIYSKMR